MTVNKKELLKKFDLNLILNLIDRFLKGYEEKVILIKTLLLNEAYAELGEVAHQFKNQFGYLCSKGNFDFFQKLETFYDSPPEEGYEKICLEIDARIHQFVNEIKGIRKELLEDNQVRKEKESADTKNQINKQSQNKTILIAEDDKISQMVLKMMLNDEYRLFLASTGFEALEIYKKELPDLVLMDINMPEVNGFEAIKRMMEESSHRAPVLAVTALFMDEERENLKKAGFDDVIVKPYHENDIRDFIKRYLPD